MSKDRWHDTQKEKILKGTIQVIDDRSISRWVC